MKKLLSVLTLLLLSVSLCLAFTGCSDEPGENMSDEEKIAALESITLPDATYVYDGEAKSLAIDGTLPEGVTVTYEGGDMTDAGVYTVVAKFSLDGEYIEGADKTATLTVEKCSADMTNIKFRSAVKTYTGKNITLTVEGEIPEWLTVSYENNVGILPGDYQARAIFSVSDTKNYTVPKSMSATLTIVFGDYASEGLVFSTKSDGSAEVSGYNGTDNFVVIPKSHDGRTVTAIKNSAFAGNTTVTTVNLPDTVKSIGASAFNGCAKLDTVVFGSSLNTIGGMAFANTAITSISVPDSVTVIGNGAFEGTKMTELKIPFVGGSANSFSSYLGYLFGATDYAANVQYVPTTLIRVELSDKCTKIPAFSFYGIRTLKEIVIGKGVTKIENSAFSGCTGIKSIFIPKTVTSIPAATYGYNSPFYGCSSDLKIVLESTVPSGYGSKWKSISDSKQATVIESTSYDKYVKDYVS